MMKDKQDIHKSSKISVIESEDINDKQDSRKFSFNNGDTYEGEYMLNLANKTLTKHGKGVYVTDDFNTYYGNWENDKIADQEFHIYYNKGAEYIGEIDANGQMNNKGTYIFPDGSLIEGIWFQNKPTADVIYKESHGYTWIVEDFSNDRISFSAGNHFWDEIYEPTDNEYGANSFTLFMENNLDD